MDFVVCLERTINDGKQDALGRQRYLSDATACAFDGACNAAAQFVPER